MTFPLYQLNWGELSPEQFLAEYWQKKPLLIRQAIPNFETIISPDEFAGLACEEEVESRIIVEHGIDYQNSPKQDWQVFHGPQDEEIFSHLPESHWTLLIQEANQHLPELASLIDCFNFIPNWRFDDVMISYAENGGSVGPHKDQYDVFLLQALGQRHWHIADYDVTDSDHIADIECKILKAFYPEQDWILNPGDMLYLPPNVIHHGIALNDCMTYSMGFRAPTASEALASVLSYIDNKDPRNAQYSDPKLEKQHSNGEISPKAIEQLIDNMQALLADKKLLTHSLAQYLTDQNAQSSPIEYLLDTDLTAESVKEHLENDGLLQRYEHCRLAFITTPPQGIDFFANGDKVSFEAELKDLIPIVSGQRILDKYDLQPFFSTPQFFPTLVDWINRGYFYLVEEEE